MAAVAQAEGVIERARRPRLRRNQAWVVSAVVKRGKQQQKKKKKKKKKDLRGKQCWKKKKLQKKVAGPSAGKRGGVGTKIPQRRLHLLAAPRQTACADVGAVGAPV